METTFTIIHKESGELELLKDGQLENNVAIFFGYMLPDGRVRVLVPRFPSSDGSGRTGIPVFLAPVLAAIFTQEPTLIHLLVDFFLDLAHHDFERHKRALEQGSKETGAYL